MTEYILKMENVSKAFPGVKALQNVNLFVKKGEIHCLMGENGAGKSTLIKILAGLYEKDSGSIYFNGETVEIHSIHEAHQLGLEFIHQELSVINALTVEENMTLGVEASHAGILDRKKNMEEAKKALERVGVDFEADTLVGDLSVSQKQMMLIAKALSRDAKLIVLDEPTASLTDVETERLFSMVRKLKEQGVTFIFVSHRMKDIFTIGERITVFRDGKNISVLNVAETTEEQIVNDMVGHPIEESYPYEKRETGEVILDVKNIHAKEIVKDISFQLHAGEIIGISGLAGAGKTELARVLFGDNPLISGEISLKGKPYNPQNPREAIKEKVALIPEERRMQGIVAVTSVMDNITLAAGEKIAGKGIVSSKKEKTIAEHYKKELNIKTPGIFQQIQYLSGGNQQKCIIGKCLNTDADVLLMDEPTRGIDVGAKAEIYEIMMKLAKEGKGIILLSSELPEILGMSDRVVVLWEGTSVKILDREEATQENIMHYAVGRKQA